jgi:hypothetical protein
MVSLGLLREPRLQTLIALVPAHIREYRPSIIFCVCALVLACSLVLGGGTRGGFLSDAILELIAIPSLLLTLTSLIDQPVWKTQSRNDAYWVLAFCFAIALFPLIQLIPLPPSIWTRLPGRDEMAKVFQLVDTQTPWMPISVTPHATWLSFLSLLPPVAIFLSAIQIGYRERRALGLLIIAFGVLSVFVGLMQVAEGQTSPLRFFAITNPTEAVGFFANRNHFAALLYTVLLFAAVWAIDIGFRADSWADVRRFETATITAMTAIFLVFVVLLAGESMARSRAGLALTIVALLGVFGLAFADRRNVSGARPNKLLLAATILAITLSVQFTLYRVLDRFAADPLENARAVFGHNTLAAAWAYMPFGSGLGSFVAVYAMFERPIDAMANTYANHAHDDILELCLETGVVGPILLCVFVAWLGSAAVKLWLKAPPALSAFDCTLGRAATVVVVLLMAHSFVDYPMRTEAIMAIFAVSCALLIEPLRIVETEHGLRIAAARDATGRRRTPTNIPAAVPPTSPSRTAAAPARGSEVVASPSRQAGGRWGEEVDWPDQWRNSEQNERSARKDAELDSADRPPEPGPSTPPARDMTG